MVQELKNVFPCSDFSIVKKAVSSGEERGHQFQPEDAYRLGNAGYTNGLDQDRLSCLLHVYKNTLNCFFYCCFKLASRISRGLMLFSTQNLVKRLASTSFYHAYVSC